MPIDTLYMTIVCLVFLRFSMMSLFVNFVISSRVILFLNFNGLPIGTPFLYSKCPSLLSRFGILLFFNEVNIADMLPNELTS